MELRKLYNSELFTCTVQLINSDKVRWTVCIACVEKQYVAHIA
jgi:hypothetical protein